MASSSAANEIKNPLKSRPSLPPSWWVTPPGRNAVAISAALAGGVYFGGITFMNSWFVNQYKNVVQLYKNGFPTPLTPDVVVRCQQTVDDMKLQMRNPNMVRFFCVFGMDMFNAGSLNLRNGSIIGVPINFSYREKSDIEKNDIVVENKPVSWGSDDGQLLQDSLILSEKAQKFGIAREIAMTETHQHYIQGGVGASAFLTYFGITRTINDKLSGFLRPKSFRILVYSLVGTFVFGTWATVTDLLTKHYENFADERAGNVNINYAKGGVEFYAKTLQRNMALRSLMGPSGENMFTYYGNDVEFIRQKHVPYTERKRKLENLAESLTVNDTSKMGDNNAT